MVVLEAMAHGLPVVVSCAHHCCITAGLRQQVNARVLETPSHDAQLACAEGALLDAPGLRARLSLGAWQYAQDFGWEGLALAQERGYLKSHPLDCPVESWQPGTVPVAHWSCRAKTAQRQ